MVQKFFVLGLKNQIITIDAIFTDWEYVDALIIVGSPIQRIIKSLIVRGSNTRTLIDEVQRYGPSVDSFITDTFDPVTVLLSRVSQVVRDRLILAVV